jgi:hypothetical protein
MATIYHIIWQKPWINSKRLYTKIREVNNEYIHQQTRMVRNIGDPEEGYDTAGQI